MIILGLHSRAKAFDLVVVDLAGDLVQAVLHRLIQPPEKLTLAPW